MADEAQLAGTSSSVINSSYSGYSQADGRPRPSSGRAEALPAKLIRYRVIKRLLDIALIVVSAPFWLPVFLLLVTLVKVTSPGPIFFSHRRICKKGAFFSMWKFRTMCVNSGEVLERYLAKHPEARAEWNKCHKLRFDPRITPVGLFLRRYSLDELPQIWNVLTGHMSLVGPRPIVAAEVEKYGRLFTFYTRVKPGLTGLWQVSGRSKLTYDARVKLDRDYVQNWTLHRDFIIIAKTLRSVLNQDGAY